MNQKIHRTYKPRKRKKGSVALAVIAVLAVVVLAFFAVRFFMMKGENMEGSSSDLSSQPPSSSSSQPSTSELAANVQLRDELNRWYLRLVNGDHPLPADFVPELEPIDSAYCRDSGFRFDIRAVDYVNAMCEAAAADNINLLVISSYRSMEKQKQLYDDQINAYVSEGYDQEEAMAKTSELVAAPGTSEHQLGLAIDLNSLSEKFDETEEYRWLSENAAEYGFILRYPKDKVTITNITYEPWHYRFVGCENARKIHEMGFCLEEYIDYLKNGA